MKLREPSSIRISGMGGQGNILMGLILAESLVKEGYWVVQSQHYGAQVRGGLSFCDVLFSEETIDYPKAETFDVLYLMHDIAFSHLSKVKNNGIIFYDSSYIKALPQTVARVTKKIIPIPASKLAYEKLGNSNVANMIGLGAIAKNCGIVSLDTLVEVMKKRVNERFYEIDEKALKIGYEFVEKKYEIKNNGHSVGRGF
ncbi:pyruvate ferredoxin oxidoreductase [Marinitoga sp. 1135]|uniref:2-oxoacid:ferredoxin oxidoreductase, gamma subunit n=1 Tax=Marinitoga piezophila (strain DSM 14283 / JCM 11233 / KA3) TaxID=443254 RepID=H2J4M4_MARPK|nr:MULTISPECIES: 2-oxoacid:acceptor oxidoreductase family protein [Marinitoga]AEX85966.1 2-oxoacid:ferredoxin oxidoreductase, gamma subunit [Marinitoga piezophila KA3]APT76390.1 pyruvate ferredoxin oxidoreductase [Marinitoga sp. 1137]NUU96160.1 pyruvate ferredoxin oxidoreductase [Marinitoga sp. 1135]NUU98068.1 pyruvate ferredoxin oxidoreductase [Marinitoga sp. 1138]